MSDADVHRAIRDGLAVYVAPENYFELRILNIKQGNYKSIIASGYFIVDP